MKKMKLILMLLVVTFAVVYCQPKPDNTFQKPMYFPYGISVGPDTTVHKVWPTGTGSMVYPGTGIPVSTGTAWGTSIVNNSPAWNTAVTEAHTAFLWGNHAGLYRPVTWKPNYLTDILGLPTLFSGSYLDLKDKPAELELDVAISQLKGIDFPVLTQTEINALPVPVKKGKVVINSTANVMQWFDGTTWKIFPTTN